MVQINLASQSINSKINPVFNGVSLREPTNRKRGVSDKDYSCWGVKHPKLSGTKKFQKVFLTGAEHQTHIALVEALNQAKPNSAQAYHPFAYYTSHQNLVDFRRNQESALLSSMQKPL